MDFAAVLTDHIQRIKEIQEINDKYLALRRELEKNLLNMGKTVILIVICVRLPRRGAQSAGGGCRMHRLHLSIEVRVRVRVSVLDMTLNNCKRCRLIFSNKKIKACCIAVTVIKFSSNSQESHHQIV